MNTNKEIQVLMLPLFLFLSLFFYYHIKSLLIKGRSRAAAISKMECFVIIVNGFHLLTIITKCSILYVAAALDLPLLMSSNFLKIGKVIVSN